MTQPRENHATMIRDSENPQFGICDFREYSSRRQTHLRRYPARFSRKGLQRDRGVLTHSSLAGPQPDRCYPPLLPIVPEAHHVNGLGRTGSRDLVCRSGSISAYQGGWIDQVRCARGSAVRIGGVSLDPHAPAVRRLSSKARQLVEQVREVARIYKQTVNGNANHHESPYVSRVNHFGVLFSTRSSGRSGVVLTVIEGGIELMFAEHRAWCAGGAT
jgi:hypothetical protein